MTLMPAAACTVVLGAGPDQFEIPLRQHVPGDRLGEAGPARAAVELVRAVEERQIAGGADVNARTFLLVQWAAEGRFGAVLEQHVIGGWADLVAPGVGGLLERRYVTAARVRGGVGRARTGGQPRQYRHGGKGMQGIAAFHAGTPGLTSHCTWPITHRRSWSRSRNRARHAASIGQAAKNRMLGPSYGARY